MLETTLLFTLKLSASHLLPNYDGKCAVEHGHTYFVDLEIAGPVDPKSGMIMDYHEVDQRCASVLPDHLCFNDHIENPTAENTAPWLFSLYNAALEFTGPSRLSGVRLKTLTLWEDIHDGQGVKVCES